MNDCPVPEDYVEKERQAVSIFQRVLQDSDLPTLHCFLLQLTFAADRRDDLFDESTEHRFVQEVLSKQISEVYGLIGCLERGAFVAAHHHARASIELAAGLSYVFSKPAKIEKRLRKYFEFDELARFNVYMSLRDADRLGVIQDAETDEGAEFAHRLEHWQGSVPEWVNLFGIKVDADDDPEALYEAQAEALGRVRSWHHPANIENMLSGLGDVGNEKMIYGFMSHGTHLSPHTKYLAGNTPIGLPLTEAGEIDFHLINRLVGVCLLGFKHAVLQVQGKLGIDFEIDWPFIE